MSENIRILIADDHAVVRRGLRALIDTEPNMEVVGEASDGVEAVDQASELQPDVILLDMVMPRKSGPEVITEIKEQNPSARILVLTSFAQDDHQHSPARRRAGRILGHNFKTRRGDESNRICRQPRLDPE